MKFLRIANPFESLSISRQLMLIVGALLFLELFFVGTLYWQLDLTEREAAREKHYKTILARTQALEYLTFEALQGVTKYTLTRNKKFSTLFREKAAAVLETLAFLKKELATHKRCLPVVERITEGVTKGLNVLNEAIDLADNATSIQDSIDLVNAKKQGFQGDWTKMLIELTELTRMESKIVSESSTEQQRMRRLIRSILAGAVLANIIFALGLSRYFSKVIISRLGVMVDNTNKFKTGKELNPLLAGSESNEITILDRSFHNMADTVVEAQRMRQTFVAMISHDLRTPLTNVQAYLSLVSEGILGEVPALVKTEAVKTEQNVARLIRLINDLLTLEKMEAGKMQMNCKVVYLESLIEKSIEAIDEFAKSQEVKIEFQETNAELYADPDRLMQVIINLASNAVKFSPKGASVEIVTIEEPDFVELQVIDHGRGVPEEYREAIFEKYKQVKAEDGSKKGGTGLGLPICKLIIEQLGGSIGVRSEDGQGSTFWFRLPQKPTEGSAS